MMNKKIIDGAEIWSPSRQATVHPKIVAYTELFAFGVAAGVLIGLIIG